MNVSKGQFLWSQACCMTVDTSRHEKSFGVVWVSPVQTWAVLAFWTVTLGRWLVVYRLGDWSSLLLRDTRFFTFWGWCHIYYRSIYIYVKRRHDALPFMCLLINDKHSVAPNCLDIYDIEISTYCVYITSLINCKFYWIN